MENLPNDLADVAIQFGQFYYKKHKEDVKAAVADVHRLRIVKMKLVNGDLVVNLAKPGVLIGNKGQNVSDLETFLGRKIRIVEDVSINEFIETSISMLDVIHKS